MVQEFKTTDMLSHDLQLAKNITDEASVGDLSPDRAGHQFLAGSQLTNISKWMIAISYQKKRAIL
ncbi:MAG: hypothetical protein V3U88_06680 [Methylococcales bacterium]